MTFNCVNKRTHFQLEKFNILNKWQLHTIVKIELSKTEENIFCRPSERKSSYIPQQERVWNGRHFGG